MKFNLRYVVYAIVGGVMLACGLGIWTGTQARNARPVTAMTVAPTRTPEPTLTLQEQVDELSNVLSIAAGGRDIPDVMMRGDVAIITLITDERRPAVDEALIDVFHAAGYAMTQGVVLSDVTIIYGGTSDMVTGVAAASAADIQAYYKQDISRAEFRKRITDVDLRGT